MKNFILYLIMVFSVTISYSLTFEGRVISANNRKGIKNAALILMDESKNILASTISFDNGLFKFDELTNGRYILEIKAMGYYTERIKINLKGNLYKTYYLSPLTMVVLDEIEVVGKRLHDSPSKNVIGKNSIEKVGGSYYNDPLNILRKMPGVDGFSEGSFDLSTFSVRGGNYIKNTVFLDGVYVQYPYHRLFPDSIFIEDLVDSITLYKGVLPSEYGQSLYSISILKFSEGESYFHGKFNFGLLNTYVIMNGSDDNKKIEYLAGLRRINYDFYFWLISQFITEGNSLFKDSVIPHYWDSQGKIKYKNINFSWIYSSEPSGGLIGYGGGISGTDLSYVYQNRQTFIPSLFWNYQGDNLKLESVFSFSLIDDHNNRTNISYIYTNINSENMLYRYTESMVSFQLVENSINYRLYGIYLFSSDFSPKAGIDILYYP